ncbi:MAG: DUF6477 family protein [Pseudomonadota bacterium]
MTLKLTRPRLMTRAARAGAAAYRRDRDLRRFLPKLGLSGKRDAIIAAIRSAEETCEAERRLGAATYSLERHIGLLSALFAEMRTARG